MVVVALKKRSPCSTALLLQCSGVGCNSTFQHRKVRITSSVKEREIMAPFDFWIPGFRSNRLAGLVVEDN